MPSFDLRAAGSRKKSILLRGGWGLGLGSASSGGEVGPIGPDANVVNAMAMPISDTAIATAFQLDGDTSGARLAVSTASDMSSPIYSARANSTSGTVKHTITGLTPATRYYYAVEVNGTLKTGTQRQCWTAPQKSGFSPFAFAFGSCGSGSNTADKSVVLSGMVGMATPPRLFIHLGDFTYDNPKGTTPADYEAIYNNGLAGQHLGLMARSAGMIYQFDDHDWHQNNSAEFLSQNPATTAYEALPQADLVVAGEVHRRRNPVPVSMRGVATPDGKNNSFAVPHGPFQVIVCDTRSRKMWQMTFTFAASYTAQTSVQVTASLPNSTSFNRPWPGCEIIGQAGIPDGTKIVSWSAIPSGTGTLTYDLVLDQPVTVTSGTTVRTKSRTLGDEQMAYIKAKFDEAVANDRDVILAWPNGLQLNTSWQDNPSAAMAGQRSEIEELYNYITDLGWHLRTITVSGDIHSTQIDEGFNVDNGTFGRARIPEWRVGSLEATTQVYASADYNVFDAQYQSTLTSHAGYITVTDNGDGTRTYALQGYQADRTDTGTASFAAISGAAHTITLPQDEIDPFDNGVSIAQTWHYAIYPRTTTISFTAQKTPVTGNLMVMVISQYPGHTTSGTLAAGWTLRNTFFSSSGVSTAVYTKIAGASEPQTINFGLAGTGSGLDVNYIELESDTGWHASLVNATATDAYAGSNRSSVSTTITTVNDNCAVLVLAATQNISRTVGTQTGWTPIMGTYGGRPRTVIGGVNLATAGALALARTTANSGIQHLCAMAFRKA